MSQLEVNLSGRFCFLLWADLGASGFHPPLPASTSPTFLTSPEALGMTDQAVLTKNGT